MFLAPTVTQLQFLLPNRNQQCALERWKYLHMSSICQSVDHNINHSTYITNQADLTPSRVEDPAVHRDSVTFGLAQH